MRNLLFILFFPFICLSQNFNDVTQVNRGDTEILSVQKGATVVWEKPTSNLLSNGDFSNGTTGWTAFNSTISVVSGALRVSDDGAYSTGSQAVTTVNGDDYTLTFDVISNPANDCSVGYDNVGPRSTSYGTNRENYTDTGSKQINFTATGTTTYFMFGSAGTNYTDYDNIVLTKDVP